MDDKEKMDEATFKAMENNLKDCLAVHKMILRDAEARAEFARKQIAIIERNIANLHAKSQQGAILPCRVKE